MNALYKNYLSTKRWEEISNLCKELHLNKCNRCENTENLQAHHKTYENLFEEKQEDLECLCRDCHEKEHGIEGRKSSYYNIRNLTSRINAMDLLTTIETLSKSQKDTHVIKVIIEDSDKYGEFRFNSVTELAKNCNISRVKMSTLLKNFVEYNFLYKISTTVYMVNPFTVTNKRMRSNESIENAQKRWMELISQEENQG